MSCFFPDYLEIKKKNSEKAKMNRQKEKSETEMEKLREGNRIRARNYRERQKALGIEKKRPKPKTRQKISEQREYCRIKKQESFSRRKHVSRKRTAIEKCRRGKQNQKNLIKFLVVLQLKKKQHRG
jgi:hypothetical protein